MQWGYMWKNININNIKLKINKFILFYIYIYYILKSVNK